MSMTRRITCRNKKNKLNPHTLRNLEVGIVKQRFEVGGLGITASGFPLPHRSFGNAQLLAESRLREPDGAAQVQDELSKGVISLPVCRSPHEPRSFPPDPPATRSKWK